MSADNLENYDEPPHTHGNEIQCSRSSGLPHRLIHRLLIRCLPMVFVFHPLGCKSWAGLCYSSDLSGYDERNNK